MNNNQGILFLLRCIIFPLVTPTAALFFWLGMRYERYGFPKMFLPTAWHELL